MRAWSPRPSPSKALRWLQAHRVLNELVSCQARRFACCLASFPSLASYSQSSGSSGTRHVHPRLPALACESPSLQILLRHNFPCGGFPAWSPLLFGRNGVLSPLTLTSCPRSSWASQREPGWLSGTCPALGHFPGALPIHGLGGQAQGHQHRDLC